MPDPGLELGCWYRLGELYLWLDSLSMGGVATAEEG